MSFNSHRGGSFNGDVAPYRSREGLSTRPIAASDEIQLRIDPGVDFDDEITGLRGQVRKLKNVAEDIGTEVKFQRDFLEQVQMTMIKAQAGVKNNLRRLNKSIIQNGSNHIVHVIVFALVCCFIVYFWSKISRK
ncbi:bet1-like protein At4g14600 [Cajanus cajan]|uniref:Bet1-like protein At4g14600 family n=1 Tax=Cajanus cajan TaxID=3821 RepID=A0A151T9V8_CAJCA|nr:bet1-like protein At4g14600 [Cajanus cajan]KYP63850.1 Bet1-like protein At4g14600 family [Cajanus cajan]